MFQWSLSHQSLEWFFELLQYILYDCSDTLSYQRKPGLFFKLGSIVVGFFVLFLFLNFQSAFEIYM